MDTTTGAISRRWQLTQSIAAGGTGHGLVWLVIALTFGAIGSLTVSVALPLVMSLGWFVVAFRGPRMLIGADLVAQRLAVVGACAWAATMFGVLAVTIAGPGVGALALALPGVGANIASHPAFGEHMVLTQVGFPWAGIEGNGLGHAADRIPFAMGIDALLVNFTLFALLFAVWLRRAPREQLVHLLSPAAVAAAVCGLAGSWRLLVLFD